MVETIIAKYWIDGNMNYLLTFFSLCKGVGCFPALSTRSLWLASWHFLLTMFICTVILTAGRMPSVNNYISTARVLIGNEFGGLSLSAEGGINVSKAPAESRVMLLPNAVSVCYLSSTLPEDLPDFQRSANAGVIFSASRLAFWFGEPQNVLFSLPANAEDLTVKQLMLNDGEVEKLFSTPQSEGVPQEQMLASSVLESLNGSNQAPLVVALFVVSFFETLLLTLPALLLFALVFGYLGAQRSAKLISLRECLVIALYASLPVMMVANLIPTLKLPYLDFQLVFLLGSIVYTIFAVNFVAMIRHAARLIIKDKINGENNHDE